MINQELLDELKTIFSEEFGIGLDDQAARETACACASYFDLLLMIESQSQSNQEVRHEQIQQSEAGK